MNREGFESAVRDVARSSKLRLSHKTFRSLQKYSKGELDELGNSAHSIPAEGIPLKEFGPRKRYNLNATIDDRQWVLELKSGFSQKKLGIVIRG